MPRQRAECADSGTHWQDSLAFRRESEPYPLHRAAPTLGEYNEAVRGGMFGRSIITGLARIDGCPVAFMAGDPYHYAGAWTADACAKVIRFVDLAQTFHPLLTPGPSAFTLRP